MKRIVHISFLFLLVSIVQAQDSENRILLGLFTPHWDNFEYLNGKVREIHYQSYHISDNEGETVKGEPFTDEEAEGVEIRRAWSLYFDQEGNMIYMKQKINDDNIMSAVIHSVNNRIENIYWIRNDSLLYTVDVSYVHYKSIDSLAAGKINSTHCLKDACVINSYFVICLNNPIHYRSYCSYGNPQ